MSSDLFRKEAIDAKKTKWTGNIILSRPFSFTFLTLASLCIALIIIFFSIFGSYTKRTTVQGQLVPHLGLVHVYTSQQGYIIKKFVYEGKKVKKGDILFVITTSILSEEGDTAFALSKETQNKEESIQNEIMRMHQIHRNDKETLLNQINLLQHSIIKIDNLLLNQKHQIDLAKINQNRYEKAFEEHAVSTEEVEKRKIEVVNQISNYELLLREKINTEKQLNEQKISLHGIENKQKNEIEQLERLRSSNQQEYIEINSRKSIAIQAHVSGVVSTVNVEMGQFVDLSKPLMTILPENSSLIAQLYVPSQSIGFVKNGDLVLLRYRAYPYQKFGHAKAKVISVAKTAWASQDLQTIGTISREQQLNNDPVYLVRVQPEKQTIMIYGHEMPLQVGMTLDGDIYHEKRKLYEWALEPLFSITGKI